MLKKNVSNGTGTNFYKDNTGSVESPGLYKPSDINESKLIKSRHDNSTQQLFQDSIDDFNPVVPNNNQSIVLDQSTTIQQQRYNQKYEADSPQPKQMSSRRPNNFMDILNSSQLSQSNMQVHNNNNQQTQQPVRAITATTNLSSLYENPTDNKPANLDLSKFMLSND